VIHTIISLGSNPQLIQQAAAVVLVPEAEKKSEIRQAAGIWMILTVEVWFDSTAKGPMPDRSRMLALCSSMALAPHLIAFL
jgi:hypothetical protein